MDEKYMDASIIFLRELYEREDAECQKLKRKRDISHSSAYNERIRYHEWHKKLIEYLIMSTNSLSRSAASSAGNEANTIENNDESKAGTDE